LARWDAALTGLVDDLVGPSLAPGAVVVDVGFSRPDTTLQLADALGARWPGLSVVGVDVDDGRVDAARAAALPGVSFEAGAFVGARHGVALVRMMNVLRQYRRIEHDAARLLVARALAPHGWLVEGSCDRDGALGVARLYQECGGALVVRGALFVHDDPNGFHPRQVIGWLPADARSGRATATGYLGDCLALWARVWAETPEPDPRERWARCAAALRTRVPGVRVGERGTLWWPRQAELPLSAG
jgi:hypothetical protein